jgi:hypothetical protein
MTPRETEMLKIAYLVGFQESGMTKEAIPWGMLGGDLAGYLGRLGASGVSKAGKGLWRGVQAATGEPARALYAGIGRKVGRGLVQAGQTVKQLSFGVGEAAKEPGRLTKFMQRMGAAEGPTRATKFLSVGGREVPMSAAGFGLLGGVTGGLSDPNQGWSWSGAGKGFLGGAAGGVGWTLGGRAVRGTLRSLAARNPTGRLAKVVGERGAAMTGPYGQALTGAAKAKSGMGYGDIFRLGRAASPMEKAKLLGIRTAVALPTAAAMLGGNMATEQGVEHLLSGGKPDEASQFRQRYSPAVAATAASPRAYRGMTRGYY